MSRKKKVDEQPQATPEAAPPVVQPRAGFPAWLDTMTCTKPFTVEDCTTLFGMLKLEMPGYAIDVHFDATHVHVRAYEVKNPLWAAFSRDLELK